MTSETNARGLRCASDVIRCGEDGRGGFGMVRVHPLTGPTLCYPICTCPPVVAYMTEDAMPQLPDDAHISDDRIAALVAELESRSLGGVGNDQ